MPRAEAKYKITAQDDTQRGLRSAGSRIDRFGRNIARAIAPFAIALASGFALLNSKLAQAQERLDKFAKTGVELGLDAEEVRELSFAAAKLGVDAGKAASAYDRFNRALGDDSKETLEALETLGRSADWYTGFDDATDRLAIFGRDLDRLEQRAGRAVRENVEQTLIGRNVSRLFAEGGEALEREARRAREIGLIGGTNEAAAAAERAADAWLEAGLVWEKLFERAGFFEAMERAANLVQAGAGVANEGIQDQSALNTAARGLSPLYALVELFRDLNRRAEAGNKVQQRIERNTRAATGGARYSSEP